MRNTVEKMEFYTKNRIHYDTDRQGDIPDDAPSGDKLLDNQDMCELLGVTKRTLARYRQKKLVTYYMIDGRTYYKASEVQDFLNKKGKVLPAKIKKELGLQS